MDYLQVIDPRYEYINVNSEREEIDTAIRFRKKISLVMLSSLRNRPIVLHITSIRLETGWQVSPAWSGAESHVSRQHHSST